MSREIERDLSRFKQIVKGKVRQQLRKYISSGEMIGRKGREYVSIPVPNINLPHFRHGDKGSSGVGQGEGDVGTPIGSGEEEGQGSAGNQPGGHVREVEVSLEELAEILAQELELPVIEPKGQDVLSSRKDKYSSIRTTGPESLRHFKRTYRKALRRLIASDEYDPRDPVIIPTRDDRLYRSWKTNSQPQANAVILYIMDVSGSMTDEQKEIVRIEAFWIDTWLKSQYDGLQRRYIIHDAAAQEVDEETFYHTRESGGTRISSAYHTIRRILDADFPVADWNIYCFQFSDGDNWGEDNQQALDLLSNSIIPDCNLFCYGQVESPYGSGDFIKELRKIESNFDNLILSEIENREAVYQSIKTFLGKGK